MFKKLVFENDLTNDDGAEVSPRDKMWTKAGCSGITSSIEIELLCSTTHSIQQNSKKYTNMKKKYKMMQNLKNQEIRETDNLI